MLVCCPKKTARACYIIGQFAKRYGLNQLKFTTDTEAFQKFRGLKMAYGSAQTDALCLPQHPQMQREAYANWKPSAPDASGFACRPWGDWHYDPFALAFYYLSRHEEYASFPADAHGRFPAAAALAKPLGFPPIVDEVFAAIARALQAQYPQWEPPVQQRNFQASFDIDYAYAFRHKGFGRYWAGGLRNLLRRDWGRLKAQWASTLGQPDPYDYFDRLLSQGKKQNPAPHIFWLLGDWGAYDKNNRWSNSVFQQQIRALAEVLPFGLHPSYRAATDIQRLKREKERLESIVQQPVQHSRQHFLRLRFPQTYRQLLEVGIRNDYTMGFAEVLGYRAGTAHPFDWFDLEKNESTELRIHPFSFMDVTLQNYLQLSPQAALQKAQPYRAASAAAMGVFHNNSFCDRWEWAGWRSTLEALAWDAE